MNGRGCKQKGANYERELAAYINERVEGVRSRRALLSGGGRNEGGADLDGTPGVHIEAKRTETFAPYAAMEQAEKAIAKMEGCAPPMAVVVQRRNRMSTGESLVVMRLDEWLRLYELLLRSQDSK